METKKRPRKHKVILNNDGSFTFLELPKFNKSIDELHTITEKWTYFFIRDRAQYT